VLIAHSLFEDGNGLVKNVKPAIKGLDSVEYQGELTQKMRCVSLTNKGLDVRKRQGELIKRYVY
jgi:hypothetical protein